MSEDLEDCVHGIALEWCGVCNKADSAPGATRFGSYGYQGGETKQDVLDDVCRLLKLPRQVVSLGSSLPSEVFAEAARQTGVMSGSMPEICEAIVKKAGHRYSNNFDSRATSSGGGSTVTLEGIQALRSALRALSS